MVIKRALYPELKKHLKAKEISLIVGPRQAGKTTLMLWLKNDLEKKGAKTVFLNLDVEADKQFFVSQASLIKKIQLEVGQQKAFVFIDEIQRQENAGLFLKGIYDLNSPYKFIVSGSGSAELKEKIHESLAGRKRIFHLETLSFREWVNFQTDYRYQNKLADFFQVEAMKTEALWREYCAFGGYPRVVLAAELTEKQKLIDEIYQSYLEKDIAYLLQIKKTEAFSQLVKLMASQIGQLVNYSELSSSLGVSVKTIKNYLWYLEKTFILKRVNPFYRNLRKEITKAPLFYFEDLGLRNYALGLFGRLETNGFLFQNFVWRLLEEKLVFSSAKIGFWRTKDGAEVDLVIDLGQKQIPIEVKCQALKKPAIPRALRSFIKKYQPEKAFLVNLKLKQEVSIDKTKVFFIPFYDLLFQKF